MRARRRAHLGGDLLLRQSKIFHEVPVAHRLFNRVEILPREVVDERERHRLAVAELLDDDGHLRKPRHPGGAPAALPRDELVAAVGHRAHDERLQHAVLPDGISQIGERRRVELLAGLTAVGLDLADRQRRDGRLVGGIVGEKRLQALAQSPFCLCQCLTPYPSGSS